MVLGRTGGVPNGGSSGGETGRHLQAGGYQGKLSEGDTLELGGPQIKEETAALAPQL